MLIANIGYPIANNYLFRSCSVVTKPDPMKSKYDSIEYNRGIESCCRIWNHKCGEKYIWVRYL